jgi:hypothetical protein
MINHGEEVGSRERYELGQNWSRFLENLTDEQTAAAAQSLNETM